MGPCAALRKLDPPRMSYAAHPKPLAGLGSTQGDTTARDGSCCPSAGQRFPSLEKDARKMRAARLSQRVVARRMPQRPRLVYRNQSPLQTPYPKAAKISRPPYFRKEQNWKLAGGAHGSLVDQGQDDQRPQPQISQKPRNLRRPIINHRNHPINNSSVTWGAFGLLASSASAWAQQDEGNAVENAKNLEMSRISALRPLRLRLRGKASGPDFILCHTSPAAATRRRPRPSWSRWPSPAPPRHPGPSSVK